MNLTYNQLAALKDFRKFLTRSEEPVFLLRGYAGTGKTTLLKTLLAELKQPAVLLAPTGRAARVMTQQSGREASTIHRGIYDFEKLKRLQTEDPADDAKKSFKYFFDLDANNAPAGTVFVVDEASMVGDAFSESEFFRLGSGHLLRDLLRYVQPTPGNGYKILFVGDRAQLPPVGDSDSWALDQPSLRQRLGGAAVGEFELTEVIRQQAHSGILANATAVRECLRRQDFAGLRLERGSDVRDVAPSQVLATYLAASGGPQSAPDEAIIITYSNNLARGYNQLVRAHFFPDQPTVSVGDRLIITQNNYLAKDNPLYNGEFAEVREVREGFTRTIRIFVNGEAVRVPLVWRPVRLLLTRPDGSTHEASRLLLDDFLLSRDNSLRSEQVKALYVDAIQRWRTKTGHDERHAEFGAFLQQDSYFHAVRAKYGYAITCHKAQGGTWRTALVDFQGFSGQRHAHYFRWVYTALTRASQQLYLLNEGGFAAWDGLKVLFEPGGLPPAGPVPLPAAVVAAHTDSYDELEELERRLSQLTRPLPMRRLLRRVAGQLSDHDTIVTEVQSSPYLERYTLTRGDETGQVVVDYGKDELFKKARLQGSHTALAQEAVAHLNAPPPTTLALPPLDLAPDTPPSLQSFLELLGEQCAAAAIVVLCVEVKPYAYHYHVQDESGRAMLLINFNGKHQVTTAQLTRHSSATLGEKLHQLLTNLN